MYTFQGYNYYSFKNGAKVTTSEIEKYISDTIEALEKEGTYTVQTGDMFICGIKFQDYIQITICTSEGVETLTKYN